MAYQTQAFVMKITGKKRYTDSFELKKGLCPVNGMNSIAGYPGGTVYRVDKWVFTGGAVVTDGLMRKLPKGCLVCAGRG